MTVSLLLHGVVLYFLGAVGASGPAAEPRLMVAYLAMPAAVTEKAADQRAAPEKENSESTAKRRPAHPVPKNPVKVETQPAATVVPDQKPLPEPPPSKELHPSEEPGEGPFIASRQVDVETLEPLASVNPTTSGDPQSIDPGPAKVIDPSSNQSVEISDPANHQSQLTNHQGAILAFVGDPAALGKILPDALEKGLVEARILELPEPAYPALSRKRGEEGKVIIKVEISAEGKVLKARVARSSSYSRLDRAALKAIESAAFTPATKYGTPVESVKKIAYRFELEN